MKNIIINIIGSIASRFCTLNIYIILLVIYHNSQIHAYNPKAPAERDLLCYKPILKVFSICSHEIPNWGSHKRYIDSNYSWVQKWYKENQDLEVKTKSLLQTIECGNQDILIGIYTWQQAFNHSLFNI